MGVHDPMEGGKPFNGTRLYSSVGADAGHTVSRRDDLESLAYIIVHLARGALPWHAASSEAEMIEQKAAASAEEVCGGLPAPFAAFLRAVRRTEFDAAPECVPRARRPRAPRARCAPRPSRSLALNAAATPRCARCSKSSPLSASRG